MNDCIKQAKSGEFTSASSMCEHTPKEREREQMNQDSLDESVSQKIDQSC
jgi:hypothetical protein